MKIKLVLSAIATLPSSRFPCPDAKSSCCLIKDLNLKPEEVPFLAGETVNADQEGKCAGFNKIMAELPKTLPNSHVISSAGCTFRPSHACI